MFEFLKSPPPPAPAQTPGDDNGPHGPTPILSASNR